MLVAAGGLGCKRENEGPPKSIVRPIKLSRFKLRGPDLRLQQLGGDCETTTRPGMVAFSHAEADGGGGDVGIRRPQVRRPVSRRL